MYQVVEGSLEILFQHSPSDKKQKAGSSIPLQLKVQGKNRCCIPAQRFWGKKTGWGLSLTHSASRMSFYFISAAAVCPAIFPNTTISVTALPPIRFAPWTPPTTSPAA